MIIRVYVNDEYYNEGPTHAIIDWTLERVKRIQKLRRIREELSLASISEYFDIEWKRCSEDVDEDEATLKDLEDFEGMESGADFLVIHNNPYLKGHIKNSDITVTSDTITPNVLNGLERVLECPAKDLPLLLGKFKSLTVKEELQRRLKK